MKITTQSIIALMTIFMVTTFTSCSNLHNQSKILRHSGLVAYVISRPVKGQISPITNDIVIMDPVSSRKYFVTHDYFDNVYPLWSPDGQRLLFERGYRNTGGIPGQYYIFNLDSKRITRFGAELATKYPKIFKNLYTRPAWTANGKSLIIYANREIYIADTAGTEIRPFWHCPGNESSIDQMTMSPNGHLLALSYSPRERYCCDSGLDHLAFLDMRDTTFYDTEIPIYYGVTWFNNGNSCLLRLKGHNNVVWSSYSTLTHKLAEFPLPSYYVYADFTTNGSVVAIGAHQQADRKVLQVARYNLKSKSEYWLTSGNANKADLSAYHYPVK